MAEINWTAEAERWLHDIYYNIAQDKPVAAANVVLGIYAKTQLLRDYPEIGYMYRNETVISAFYCTVIIESRI